MTEKTQRRSLLKRGDAAKETLRKEQEAAAARRAESESRGLFRFYVQKNEQQGGGRRGAATVDSWKEHSLIILDDDVTQAPFAHVHEVNGPNGDYTKKKFIPCIDELQDCPICRAAEANNDDRFKHASYDMYCTVIDETEHRVKSGPRAGEIVPFTRKLYVIPQGAVAAFMKVAEACKKKHGTTRGMNILVTKHKQQDARCGVMMPFDSGSLFEMVEESVIEDEFWNEEERRDNKVIKAAGIDIEPADYEAELEPLEPSVMRTLFGLSPAAGSEEDEQQSIGSSRAGRRRARASSRGQGSDDQGDQGGGDQGDNAPPPRTRRGARAAAEAEKAAAPEPEPAGRTRRRTRSAEEQQPEPEPTGRTRRRSGGPTNDLDDDIPF